MKNEEPLVEITSTVRGGGIVGSRFYVARILGPDPRWTFHREFLWTDREGLSNSGCSGYITVEIFEPGVFEVSGRMTRGRSISQGDHPRYYVLVDANGDVTVIPKADVLRHLASPAA